LNVSPGQTEDAPEQFSATSHEPADARHVTVFGANVSVGQDADEPVHVSETSQLLTAGRQTVVEIAN
jgi:hypothetical protein